MTNSWKSYILSLCNKSILNWKKISPLTYNIQCFYNRKSLDTWRKKQLKTLLWRNCWLSLKKITPKDFKQEHLKASSFSLLKNKSLKTLKSGEMNKNQKVANKRNSLTLKANWLSLPLNSWKVVYQTARATLKLKINTLSNTLHSSLLAKSYTFWNIEKIKNKDLENWKLNAKQK